MIDRWSVGTFSWSKVEMTECIRLFYPVVFDEYSSERNTDVSHVHTVFTNILTILIPGFLEVLFIAPGMAGSPKCDPEHFITEAQVREISKSVFMGLCRVVGTTQVITMRRDMMDVFEMVYNHLRTRKKPFIRYSGSESEGFRLKGSDMDTMFWPGDHTVVWNLSQSQYYHRRTVLLADCTDSPPGYALLQLLTPTVEKKIESSLLRINNERYLSSSKYRVNMCSEVVPNSTQHGPCGSGKRFGIEIDCAHCFGCIFWPPSASLWINRCHSWPPPHIIHDIVSQGCHFAAIGHKLGNHEHNEWRISFSLAERKLVYSMNHCQFLTYGLLKLFLKEVINRGLSDEEKLLCSYHIKTAVFWTIQQNTIPYWCPQNLLECFLLCFKFILKWVYEGVCPNFFIPQNNMFLGKIQGSAQFYLFNALYALYDQGYACLLHCASIKSNFLNVLYNPSVFIRTDQRSLISETEFDCQISGEMYNLDSIIITDPKICMKYMRLVEQLLHLPLTKYHFLMLQKLTASVLQRTAFILHNTFSTRDNKQKYIINKLSRQMLKLAAQIGCTSDLLYIALFYYKTKRYVEALAVLRMTKTKFSQPYLAYTYAESDRYEEAVGGQSWSKKFRRCVAQNIKLYNGISYIYELNKEQDTSHGSSQMRHPFLIIPPFVFLQMLEVLCCRPVDAFSTKQALEELHSLLCKNDPLAVPVMFRDISWQILGICQQETGNYQEALNSFQQSIKEYPYHGIRQPTCERILKLLPYTLRPGDQL
ncbi:uncharacterized protein LOC134232969 [Saccostrea cucullata]|uniref:uncharacterized protein LOC134232969 n=1 Tax=Saccostrea cuccullata TaxID=36930 RepID=UPI002ED0C947